MKCALLAIPLLLVAGCWPSFGVEATKVRPAAPDDAAVTTNVLARISGRPGLDVSAVSASVSEGALTLQGSVATIFDRSEIERLASGVRGVVLVRNQLEVMNLQKPDEALQGDADRALGAMPRLRGFRLQVSVSEGVLSLEGEVPLARDRIEAEEIVSKVPGVLSIRNQLHLPAHPVDPKVVRRRIEGLLQDKLVFGAIENLSVKVTPEGEVTLEGVVPSQADRQRAERIAYGIRGVISIVNNLVVGLVGASPP
jgi:hyperosmotically inducible protein